MVITPLTPDHAAAAARLHIAGQPGTFLTSLGPDVLTILYRRLPVSSGGFGLAAVAGADVVGFVSATTSTGRLFVEMGSRDLLRLAAPLAVRFARQPSLALRSVQTVIYPFLAGSTMIDSTPGPGAELLSIMVEPAWRSCGIGALLLAALLQECRNRRLTALHVTVDASNQGAQRFYRRSGFALQKEFVLYGRPMLLLERSLGAPYAR